MSAELREAHAEIKKIKQQNVELMFVKLKFDVDTKKFEIRSVETAEEITYLKRQVLKANNNAKAYQNMWEAEKQAKNELLK